MSLEIQNRIFTETFILGFFANAIRSFPYNFINEDNFKSKSIKYSLIMFSYNRVLRFYSPVLSIILFSVLRFQNFNITLSILSSIVIYLISFDPDILRSVFNRRPLSPIIFLIGNLLTIILYLHLKNSVFVEYIPIAPWVFLIFYNLFFITTSTNVYFNEKFTVRAKFNFLRLFLSFSDGLILNFPFMISRFINLDNLNNIALIMRVYSSSVFFLPVLFYWIANGRFNEIAGKLNISPFYQFILFSSIMSIFTGLLFYLYIEKGVFNSTNIFCLISLLVSISFFFASTRIKNNFNSSFKKSELYIYLLLFFILTTTLLFNYVNFTLRFVLSQSLLILLCSLIPFGVNFIKPFFRNRSD